MSKLVAPVVVLVTPIAHAITTEKTPKGAWISTKRLRDLLEYRPETGELIARTDHGKGQWWAGERIGFEVTQSGYRRRMVMIDRRSYVEARLIWQIQTGRQPRPGYDIHHDDGNALNNSWSNLQELPHSEHMRLTNRQKPTIAKSGVRNVHRGKNRKRWVVQVTDADGKPVTRYVPDAKHGGKDAALLVAAAMARALRIELHGSDAFDFIEDDTDHALPIAAE